MYEDFNGMRSPPTGAPNVGWVDKNCIFQTVEKSPDQIPYHWKFVSHLPLWFMTMMVH